MRKDKEIDRRVEYLIKDKEHKEQQLVFDVKDRLKSHKDITLLMFFDSDDDANNVEPNRKHDFVREENIFSRFTF